MTTTETYDTYELDDEAPLPPPRPRRRLTRLTGSLLGVLLLAGGFLGGVLVQKQAGEDGGGGAAPSPFAAMAAGGAPGGGAGLTVGEVASVKGDVLYVTDATGNTLKVTAAKGATVTRTADAKPREIRPGERVVVRGTARNGAVAATSIAAGDASASMAMPAGTLPGSEGSAASEGAGQRRGADAGGGDAVDQLFDDGSAR